MKQYLPISSEEKIKLVQQKLLELAEKHKNAPDNFTSGSSYQLEKNAVLDDLFYKEDGLFVPYSDWTKLQSYLQNIRYVITTSVGKRLREIGRVE